MACSSQSTKVQEIFSAMSSVTTTLVNKTENQVDVSSSQGNSFTFINKGNIKNCNISITQANLNTQKISIYTQASSTDKLKTDLTTALQNAVSTLSKETSDALAAGFASSQKTDVDINTSISNFVNTSITNDTSSKFGDFVSQWNSNKFVNYGNITCEDGQSITITQQNLNKAVISAILASLATSDIATSIKNNIEQSDDNTTESKFTNWIDSVGNNCCCGQAFLGAALFCCFPCILVFICIIACCGASSMGGKSNSNSSPPATSTPAAAAFGKKLKKALRTLKKIS